jgi:hypothetical protein
MKKLSVLFLLGMGFLLSACGMSAKDMSEYVDVDFSGYDTKGTATFTVDEDKMYKDAVGYEEGDMPDQKTIDEMNHIADAYEIKLDKDDNLSNGDKVKVTVTVDDQQTKKIKSGEKTVEVKGLEKPETLTNDMVTKGLVFNFNGVSGRGVAQMDAVFDSPVLNGVAFEVKEDGQLKNGDQATITVSKDEEVALNEQGIVLAKDFAPTVEVKGLDEVAAKATDIANLKDVKRMIDEQAKRAYKGYAEDQSYGQRYEIKQEKLMYRAFDDGKNDDAMMYFGGPLHGMLVGIYTVKQYTGGDEGKLVATQTAIVGYSNLLLDKDQKVNVADMQEIELSKDDSYSLESVIQLYESYGYTEVK